MPRRKTSARKAPARKGAATAASVPASVAFQVGQAVLDAADPARIAVVCTVLAPGLSYRVRFADDTQCITATQSSLTAAPAGVDVPSCTADC